jgi:hypothetical protein
MNTLICYNNKYKNHSCPKGVHAIFSNFGVLCCIKDLVNIQTSSRHYCSCDVFMCCSLSYSAKLHLHAETSSSGNKIVMHSKKLTQRIERKQRHTQFTATPCLVQYKDRWQSILLEFITSSFYKPSHSMMIGYSIPCCGKVQQSLLLLAAGRGPQGVAGGTRGWPRAPRGGSKH